MVAAVVVLAIAGALLLVGLDAYPLWDPDEGRHALIAFNVRVADGWRGWVLPQLYGRPYHDKPILYYWLTAAAYAVGGTTTTSARGVSACSALATVALVYWTALRAWGVAVAATAGLVLVTAIGFLALGRFASLDMLLAAWVTLGIVAMHHAARPGRRSAWLLVAAGAAGAGMLAKGLVAPMLIGGIGAADLALSGRLRDLRVRDVRRAILVFVVVAVPWYAVAGWLDPAYLRDFFLQHHLARFVSASGHLHPEPFWHTPLYALALFLPWSAVLPAVAGDLARRGADDTQRLCVIWALAVVAFFSVSSGKLVTYVLPALPPLAMLVGRFLTDAMRDRVGATAMRWLQRGLRAASVVWIVAAGLVLVGPALLRASGPWAERLLIAVGSGLAAAVLWRLATNPSVRVPVAALVAVVSLTALTAYGMVMPRLDGRFSDAGLAHAIRGCDPDGVAPVLVWGVPHGSLSFYLQRAARPIAKGRELRRAIARRDLVFVVAGRSQVPELQRVTGDGLRVVAVGRHVLLAAQPITARLPPELRATAAVVCSAARTLVPRTSGAPS